MRGIVTNERAEEEREVKERRVAVMSERAERRKVGRSM